ncbi:MAG: signal recognition particle protein [Alphaproteobacteria bacterium]|jgi:signal recognition particle subunit SRP54|nr:signal recognition particle protein [Alphaproteobacteria bacterium]MDP6812767.1 signal recognition particle protein [Alphaproteobacteria bacterium]
MFDSLTGRLGEVFDKLTRRGALSEADVDAALREVRVALLEADVALPVARDFVAKVREQAVGEAVVKSVTPGQMVVKIVHDALVETLGSEATEINLNAVPPVPILMVGLQGSGKTTTTAKIAKRLQDRDKKKVLMASLDTRRPAAMEQLKILGEQAEVATLPIVEGQMPVDIAKRAIQAAKLQGFDAVLLDTAGRMHVDEALMAEVAAVRDAVQPAETLLVADSLTGQDAVNVAQQFNERLSLTGIALTRVDGDGRGGAALSMRAVTGCPIKLLGIGEKLDALEAFHPDRIAGRILGMGDVVGLVEKAAETIDQQDAEKLAKKVQKGQFDLNDLLDQLRQIGKMGGLDGLMAMLPGVGQMKKQMAQANIDPKLLKRQEAIIQSMTAKERTTPKLIHASRKKRIAAGSGTSVQDVNRLLKQFKQMSGMMKKVNKLGKKGLMRQGLPGMPGLPGAPGLPPPR